MQLSVKGKQIDVGDVLRRHIEDSLPAAVTKYFENPTDAQVTLAREGKEFRADITVHVGKGIVVQGHGTSEDAYAAFDTATVHVAKRLRRYKRRLRDHHRGREETPATLAAQQYVIEPQSETEEGVAGDQPGDQPVVVAEMATRIETLTVSEAVMRMDLSDQSALMFRNRAHGGLNMVYVRSDGNIGWIDPQNSADSQKPGP